MEGNIYQSPEANALLEPEHLDAEGLRERYNKEEIIVLAVGWFYYFFGSFLLGLGISLFTWWFMEDEILFLLPVAVCMIIGPVYIITGYGLRRFDLWARIPAMFAAVVAMFLPPAGLLAGAVSFYLLKRNASQEMFTSRYQTAIISEGEINRHFGWLGIMGGLLTALTVSLGTYLFTKGFF